MSNYPVYAVSVCVRATLCFAPTRRCVRSERRNPRGTHVSSVDPVNTDESVVDKTLVQTGNARVTTVDFEVAFRRRVALFCLEIAILLLCCSGIIALWDGREPPPMSFAVLVAVVLFAANAVCGTYRRAVYIDHVARLARSALAHGLGGVVMALPIAMWFDGGSELPYLVGMVAMAYFITNTLRPVLVEVLRAGNKLDQRRQPGSSISVS